MKKIYFTFLSFVALASNMNAQLTLTQAAYEPVISDIRNSTRFDSVSVVVPKNTGTNQTWNFNTLTPNFSIETSTYVASASTPSTSFYPTSTIALARGTGSSVDYFKTSTNKLEIVGFVDAFNNEKAVFTTPAPWYNWPMSYATASSGTFAAAYTSGTNAATWAGTYSYLASGTGTVILPGGNVHTNCLQFRRVIDIVMTGAMTGTMHLVQYEYFSSTKKLPIMEVEYNVFNDGLTINFDINIDADITALNVGVNEITNPNSELILFPNPASENVTIVLPNNEIASSIEIIDVTGKIVASGLNVNTINVATLAKSVYTIRVKTKDSILQKSLAITD